MARPQCTGGTRPVAVWPAHRTNAHSLAANMVPNMHLTDTGQCFPMYWYEAVQQGAPATQAAMFDAQDQPAVDGYVRRDSITKEDIFWYVYGILHSPEYKSV